jgi:hypothetical protein
LAPRRRIVGTSLGRDLSEAILWMLLRPAGVGTTDPLDRPARDRLRGGFVDLGSISLAPLSGILNPGLFAVASPVILSLRDEVTDPVNLGAMDM